MAVSLVREMAPAAAVVMPVTVEDEPSSCGFVRRDQELGMLLALLDPRRSEASAGIVVSGIAGVGKTALARQAARTAVGRGWFPGGAVIVDLHGYDLEPIAQVATERVYVSLLRALDPDGPVPATVDEQASGYHGLMSHLDQLSRPVLLVVDNADSTDQIIRLLPAGQVHRVLITSRHALEGLSGVRRLQVDALTPDLAIELLGTRRPGDPRLGADPAAAAELARLCGHVPLALQIIAVLMADDPARPAAELVTELADETTRLQSLPGEQWPGRAAVGLAYRRLDDFSARLFHLLAAAPAPDVAAEAAVALANQPVEQIRPALAALARMHLLEFSQPGRWRMHDQIRRYATELAAPRESTRPRATSHGRVSRTDRHRPQRWLLLAALVIAIAASVFTLLKPVIVNTGTGAARLTLSTAQVKIGDSYFIRASGFSPGEAVRFSWTGPSNGVMGIFSTDSDGNKSPDPVFERHPPGNYTITGTGLTSGRIASAGLEVTTGTGPARLVLSTSEVKIGDPYFATAWGFVPEEQLRFSVNRANGVIGVFPAGSAGSRWNPIVENGPPGNYTVTVTGLTSGHTASAELKVVQPGS
ncbi:MAG: hypothetical protein QOJ06_1623 [Pseudonocardiales bacterium]|nr:hypothetical protein [Pseudonocardiales bacterium]